jgi:hypothetical protein
MLSPLTNLPNNKDVTNTYKEGYNIQMKTSYNMTKQCRHWPGLTWNCKIQSITTDSLFTFPIVSEVWNTGSVTSFPEMSLLPKWLYK